MGRPVSNNSEEAKRRRERQRRWYASLSTEQRKAIVKRRNKDAQRRADEKRDRKRDPERQRQHNALVAKAKRENPALERSRASRPKRPAGQKCTYPGCDRAGTEWHHTSKSDLSKGTWRCPRHNPRGGAAR